MFSDHKLKPQSFKIAIDFYTQTKQMFNADILNNCIQIMNSAGVKSNFKFPLTAS